MFRSRRSFPSLAIAATLFPLLTGCATEIAPLNATPNIALLAQARSLDVAFDPRIEDVLEIVSVDDPPIVVQGWRQSLRTAFHNGFQGAFPMKEGAAADLTLRIDEASVEVPARGPHVRIQYAASLIDKSGNVVRRASGLASRPGVLPIQPANPMEPMDAIGTLSGDGAPPRAQIASGVQLTVADLTAAIDAMYEQLARDLFPCAGAVPCAATRSESVADATR